MIDIEDLKQYFENDMVFATAHSSERFRQRNIKLIIINGIKILNAERSNKYEMFVV